MYAIIFKARINIVDDEYHSSVTKLRALAIEEFGCREFISFTEGDTETSISYWESLEAIRSWKEYAEHLKAQAKGRNRWYHSVEIQVVEVIREYQHNYGSK